MRLMIDQDVYIVVEAFKSGEVTSEFYYEIIKCKVKMIPTGKFREYQLIHKGDLYWRKRETIHETYQEAVEVADRMADRYDSIWSRLDGHKLYRPWKEGKR